MPTTDKGFPYPAPGDSNDVPADLQRLAAVLNNRPGINVVTTSERDALQYSWEGRIIWNRSNQRLERYDANAMAWRPASIITHNDLGGRDALDAHPQYPLDSNVVHRSGDEVIGGTKAFTGLVRGTYFPVPFYLPGPMTPGIRGARFIAVREFIGYHSMAVLGGGYGTTYRFAIRGAQGNLVALTDTSPATLSGSQTSFFDVGDFYLGGGGQLQIEVVEPGVNASDLSVTLMAIC